MSLLFRCGVEALDFDFLENHERQMKVSIGRKATKERQRMQRQRLKIGSVSLEMEEVLACINGISHASSLTKD